MAELNTLARPYAKAVFELAMQQGSLEQWSKDLTDLAAAAQEAKVQAYIANPNQSADAKIVGLLGLVSSSNAGLKNLLQALADNNRLAIIANVREQFEALKAELGVEVQAVVTSAYELTDAQAKSLTDKLTARFGRSVSLRSEVDPTLIGGAIIRTGEITIDGSVRGKLAKLAEAMNS